MLCPRHVHTFSKLCFVQMGRSNNRADFLGLLKGLSELKTYKNCWNSAWHMVNTPQSLEEIAVSRCSLNVW